MSRDVVTCTTSTDLNELMKTMTERRFRHVPVVEDERLIGLVSIGDVVKARLDELEHDKRDLLDYVSGR
jgi:CBS domain-containing protein